MTIHQPIGRSFRPVNRYRLGADDRILIDGLQHRWIETNELAYVLRNVEAGVTREVSYEEFERDLHLEKIQVDRGYFSLDSVRRRARNVSRLSDLEPEQLAIVMHRLKWVETFDDLYKKGIVKKSPKRLVEAIPLVGKLLSDEDEADREPRTRAKRGAAPRTGFDDPSPSQLGRWVREYHAAGEDPIVLNPDYARSGNRLPRLDPVVRRLVEGMAARYCVPTKPSVQQLYERLVRILNYSNRKRATSYVVPSKRTLERAIARIDDFEKMAGRHGAAWARRNYTPAYEGPTATRPLERVEMDEWRVNLMTLCEDAGLWATMSEEQRRGVKRTRCWLTAAIDCATRCILSVYLTTEAPSARSALEGLRWIMTDKESLRREVGAQNWWPCHGKPENLFTDKGAGFKSNEFKVAALSLGIGTLKPNAGLAQFRGKIERLFRSLDQGLVSRFEGRTFSNVLDKGDYESEKCASITCEELNRALIRYICDVYHSTPHGGLGGRSPAQEWNRLVALHGQEIVPGKQEMREVFGVPFERTVGKKGIRLLGTFYQCEDLVQIWMKKQGTKLQLRVDDRDVTEISVEVAPGTWKTATAVGGIEQAVSIERLATSFAALVEAGLPAFDIDDPVEITKRRDEALQDITDLVRRSAARAGLVDAKTLEMQIARIKADAFRATLAWLDRQNSAGTDIYTDPVASPFRSEPASDLSEIVVGGEETESAAPPADADTPHQQGGGLSSSTDEPNEFWSE
ncbi:Mu transposase C-terminal domain-containing protein [Jiella mangrovi]|uniref:DDE-type integrase/transposase/recombinase n=1 Tax=Jiella mangrovi TaxID=2821407 RepID=A0ABS4BG80_9HYPH|nr:Mu transposase C-terminal domain-containing protein [Jiella mangrovi]MBP0615758.1 DDE-type integrase/transposase/recombinase [Jiella mangrovi]